jgi:hypothetical protein
MAGLDGILRRPKTHAPFKLGSANVRGLMVRTLSVTSSQDTRHIQGTSWHTAFSISTLAFAHPKASIV